MPLIVGQDFKGRVLLSDQGVASLGAVSSRPGDSQFTRRDLRIEALFDAAGWIVVAQADEGFTRRRDCTFQ